MSFTSVAKPLWLKRKLPILQQSGLRALPVTENGELVGMLTIEDVGQASLLGPLPTKTGATA